MMNQYATHEQTHLPTITPHARERWHERTPADRPLEVAWNQAEAVDAPAARCSDVRLYQPYNALLIVRDGRLRTVLINDGRLADAPFVLCDTCDDLVDPVSDDRCPSCGEPHPAVMEVGQITIVRGGERR